MVFVLSLWELGLWLAVSSITLLIVSEVASPYYGRISMLMEFKKLRKAAMTLGFACLFVISLNVMSIIYAW